MPELLSHVLPGTQLSKTKQEEEGLGGPIEKILSSAHLQIMC